MRVPGGEGDRPVGVLARSSRRRGTGWLAGRGGARRCHQAAEHQAEGERDRPQGTLAAPHV